MKPFDLQEALNGAPVKLRNGNKAFITFNLSNLKDWSEVTDLPLIGYSLNKSESLEDLHSWTLCGWSAGGSDIFAIVGMWEEPELTSEQVLEKAYQEDLKVSLDGKDVYIIIGKAKDGSYLLGSEESDSYVAWSVDFGRPEIYLDALAPKSDTITVTLPKPFKAKKGDNFWFIIEDLDDNRQLKIDVILDGNGEPINYKDGNCFRTPEDAQAWLDAIANALDD